MADRLTRQELAMLAALVGKEIGENKFPMSDRARRLRELHKKLLRAAGEQEREAEDEEPGRR